MYSHCSVRKTNQVQQRDIFTRFDAYEIEMAAKMDYRLNLKHALVRH
jgi:hypothetical protein